MDLAKMMVANVWMDRAKFEEAEMKFHAHNAGPAPASQAAAAGDAQPVVEEVCVVRNPKAHIIIEMLKLLFLIRMVNFKISTMCMPS